MISLHKHSETHNVFYEQDVVRVPSGRRLPRTGAADSVDVNSAVVLALLAAQFFTLPPPRATHS